MLGAKYSCQYFNLFFVKSECRKDTQPALKRNVFEKPKCICMKNTSPKFPSFAAKSTSAYTFGGLPHTWPSKISLFCKEAWKQVLQEGRRFPALGKAVRSCAAVTDPVALVWSSTAGAMWALKGLGHVCLHTKLLLLNSQGLSQAIGFAGREPE